MSSGWTGSWLPGSESGSAAEQQRWRGERLGLPESGAGSVSSLGSRFVALIVDALLAAGIAALFTYPDLPRNWSLVPWFAITILAVAFFGFTPGMGVMGIRVTRMDGSRMVGLLRAVPRTLLVALLLPAAIVDPDGRGLHDRLLGTVVLSTR